jgi:hypothetical protein
MESIDEYLGRFRCGGESTLYRWNAKMKQCTEDTIIPPPIAIKHRKEFPHNFNLIITILKDRLGLRRLTLEFMSFPIPFLTFQSTIITLFASSTFLQIRRCTALSANFLNPRISGTNRGRLGWLTWPGVW